MTSKVREIIILIIVKETKVECFKNIHLVKTQPFCNHLLKGGDWLCEFFFIQELAALHNTAKFQTTFQKSLSGKCQISILI